MIEAVRVAGVDEAGRGPLAGPVVAAAVILHPDRPVVGLADSKTLSTQRRDALAREIHMYAIAVGIGMASAAEIDRLNILQATMAAMKRAIEALDTPPELVRVDGNQAPALAVPVRAVVGGDASDPVISAAGIVAKVTRDEWMLQLHLRYPAYGFDRHKGYPTPGHLAALEKNGPCPEHRASFRPVRQLTLRPTET